MASGNEPFNQTNSTSGIYRDSESLVHTHLSPIHCGGLKAHLVSPYKYNFYSPFHSMNKIPCPRLLGISIVGVERQFFVYGLKITR